MKLMMGWSKILREELGCTTTTSFEARERNILSITNNHYLFEFIIPPDDPTQ
jgi:hypothetical protein